VHRLAGSDLLSEQADSDLAEAFAAQFTVEMLELKLRRETEHPFKLFQGMFGAAGFRFEVLGESAEAVGPLPYLDHTIPQFAVFTCQGSVRRCPDVRVLVHARNVCESTDGLLRTDGHGVPSEPFDSL
jgi:hypothetical protein